LLHSFPEGGQEGLHIPLFLSQVPESHFDPITLLQAPLHASDAYPQETSVGEGQVQVTHPFVPVPHFVPQLQTSPPQAVLAILFAQSGLQQA